MAAIAEVVIGEFLLSHPNQLFACGFVPQGEKTCVRKGFARARPCDRPPGLRFGRRGAAPDAAGSPRGIAPAVYTVADEVGHRRHRRTYRSRQDVAGQSPDRHRCRPPRRRKRRGITIDIGFAHCETSRSRWSQSASVSSMSPAMSASSVTCWRASAASTWCCS
jgi:hypothetical protein